MGDDLLNVEVDRHRVPQPGQRGQAHGRMRGRPGASEGAKVGVGEGEHNDGGRSLAQLLRGRVIIEAGCVADEEMHQAAMACSMAARSRPVWPITTRCPARSSPGRQGRS